MTAREFEAALRAARRTYPLLTRDALKRMLATYDKAARAAAEQVVRAKALDYSHITVESWERINRALEDGANLVRSELDIQVKGTISKGIGINAEINTTYIMDAVEEAGAGRITRVGVENVFALANRKVIRSTVNRVFADGYSYSTHVWRVGTKYQNAMKGIVNAGLAQGRSVTDIAADLKGYVRKGKPWVVNRYGPKLIRGTKDFLARVGDRIDARALRLIRSELYMSLQEAAKEQGHLAPSCLDLYDWILQAGRQHWDCDCPDLASGGPYAYADVPEFPHPNCFCLVRPVMRDRREFIDDLVRWSKGGDVAYMDNWFKNIYRQSN